MTATREQLVVTLVRSSRERALTDAGKLADAYFDDVPNCLSSVEAELHEEVASAGTGESLVVTGWSVRCTYTRVPSFKEHRFVPLTRFPEVCRVCGGVRHG